MKLRLVITSCVTLNSLLTMVLWIRYRKQNHHVFVYWFINTQIVIFSYWFSISLLNYWFACIHNTIVNNEFNVTHNVMTNLSFIIYRLSIWKCSVHNIISRATIQQHQFSLTEERNSRCFIFVLNLSWNILNISWYVLDISWNILNIS